MFWPTRVIRCSTPTAARELPITPVEFWLNHIVNSARPAKPLVRKLAINLIVEVPEDPELGKLRIIPLPRRRRTDPRWNPRWCDGDRVNERAAYADVRM
jgi:hypothetical protein